MQAEPQGEHTPCRGAAWGLQMGLRMAGLRSSGLSQHSIAQHSTAQRSPSQVVQRLLRHLAHRAEHLAGLSVPQRAGAGLQQHSARGRAAAQQRARRLLYSLSIIHQDWQAAPQPCAVLTLLHIFVRRRLLCGCLHATGHTASAWQATSWYHGTHLILGSRHRASATTICTAQE